MKELPIVGITARRVASCAATYAATYAAPLALVLVLVTALVAGDPALAAEEGHGSEGGHGGGLKELLFQTANLLLLLAVLFYFGRKPLQEFLATRRDRIQGELAESARLLKEAESRYGEWQRKLIELDQETERIRRDGIRSAEEDARSILEDARAASERIQRDAQAAIDQELRRAQAQLRAEAVALATEMASQILEQKLGAQDRERLLDAFIGSIETRGEAR